MLKIGIDKVARILITSDFFLHSGWGLVAPIFAIFVIEDQIKDGSLAAVGFIVAAYWVTKSIAQLFIAYYLDINKGEKDDFKFLIWGMYVANLVPLGYIFATSIAHLFFLEFIRGIAMASAIPSWRAIFGRHINRNWEAFSWSIESTSLGLASGLAAAFGGILVSLFGFKLVFVLVSIFGIISSSLLLPVRKHLFYFQKQDTKKALLESIVKEKN